MEFDKREGAQERPTRRDRWRALGKSLTGRLSCLRFSAGREISCRQRAGSWIHVEGFEKDAGETVDEASTRSTKSKSGDTMV